MIQIRPVNEGDMKAITTIYTHHVLHGTGTFETAPPSYAEMVARRADVVSKGLPYLVVQDTSSVLGFAYCNWFKPRPAFRYSAEDSIYLDPKALGSGLGRLLLEELTAQAQRAGVRKLIAVIGDSANHDSIGLHRACGFKDAGILAACGWKFDRWLDVVLMDKTIGLGASTAPAQSAP
jgi:L-amino acid N-acyltransferase YncA